MSQIKLKGFTSRLEERLLENDNEKLRDLESEDLQALFRLFFDELARCLGEGHRVIFDGWISVFTNPVKRKCFDAKDTATVKRGDPLEHPAEFSYKRRVRFRPTKNFRHLSENELTEGEYLSLKSGKK